MQHFLTCKHDHTFVLGQRTPYFYCGYGCGFFLNFDPVTFEDGVAYVEKNSTKPQPLLVHSK